MSDDLSRAIIEFKILLRRYRRMVVVLAIMIIGAWFFQSIFYTVRAEEQGVVLRFGKHVSLTRPGLHTKLPWPIEKVIRVPIERVQKLEFGFATAEAGRRTRYAPETVETKDVARLLTGDLNLAHVEWAVHYRINDAAKFLFALGDEEGRFDVRRQTDVVEDTISDVSETVMRQLVGDVSVDEVLTTGRDQIAVDAKEHIQNYLNKFDCGITVVTVKLQTVSPPDQVKDAFDSVNRAKQRKEQVVNEALGERNRLVPEARGQRDRAIAEAEGYKNKSVKTALGRANAFKAKALEYRAAPEVTRMRLYLEAMEDILANINDIVVLDESIRGMLPLLNLDQALPAARTQGDGQ